MTPVDLYTPEAEVLTDTPWQAYPRPQLRRDSYVNLNGYWDFTHASSEALPRGYDSRILVPFCPESILSGIHTHFPEGEYLFYRRTVTLPADFNRGRVLLHIGAADQELVCYVNSEEVGRHFGGYQTMTFDITEAWKQTNEIVFRCRDDLRNQQYPYGKQSLNRGGMWYTPVSGIWQTVWLESVPEQYIAALDIQVTETCVTVTVCPAVEGAVILEGTEYPLTDGTAVITPVAPRLWCPEDPYLYEFTVRTKTDRVESYFALRTIEAKTVDGIPRLCLNGQPYFFHGLLDQGYWSDGICTPADPECYARDILAMKKLGFNTLRKHVKVEPERFYYECDRLGMVVFQDMVNNGDYRYVRDTVLPTLGIQKRKDLRMHADLHTRQRFLQTMEATVNQLKNHPCILYWTIFNEGWGQFQGSDAYHRLKALDSSRIIDTTSGWFRGSRTDVESLHIYFDLWHRLKPSDKPLVLSEFGGFTYPVVDHLFNPDNAYGYKTCKSLPEFQEALEKLYRNRILPAIPKGLCAAIYTQISDVEDEINGILTYDRKVCKAEEAPMLALSRELAAAIRYSCPTPDTGALPRR